MTALMSQTSKAPKTALQILLRVHQQLAVGAPRHLRSDVRRRVVALPGHHQIRYTSPDQPHAEFHSARIHHLNEGACAHRARPRSVSETDPCRARSSEG